MGPLANLFRRSDSSSPSKKQQHSTLDVPLPTSPFNLTVDNSRTDDAGTSPPLERRFGPRLPRDASSSAIRQVPAGPFEPPTLARSGQGDLMTVAGGRSDLLAQRIEALSLGGEEERMASSSSAAFASSSSALPGHSRPLVPFTTAVRALRVSSGPSTTLPLIPPSTLPLPPPDYHHQPPPPPCSPAHAGSASHSTVSKPSLPPAVPPRPTFRNLVPSSPSDTSRRPFAPIPPTPPRRRPSPMSQSAPVLPGRPGQPVPSRAPDGRGAGLPPPVDVFSSMRTKFAYSSGAARSIPPPQICPLQQESPPYASSKSFSLALPRPPSPDENELPPPHTIGRAAASRTSPPSPASPKPSPTTPIRKAPRWASEPVRSSDSPASARPSPASSRRGANSAVQSRQCDGITALSKRRTRTVSLVGWAIPAEGVELASPDGSAGAGQEGPVYCKQHAKLALVDSGCFVTVKTGEGATRERWISFADWIDADLPIETQALLRHYMSKPVSRHDQEGYIYVHELVPRVERGFARSAPLDSTAHIKLGRTLKPVARLSQWRANCPSREPIVRFVFPRATQHGSMHFAARGTRNHHRWERLCLVELAGRAIPAADEKCADCGARHVECFRIDRGAVSQVGGGHWDVVQVVEKWERWCRDVLG